MRVGFLAIFLIVGISNSHADVPFSIIQTSDIHSHYLNNEHPFMLGGVARLATKIQLLRSQKQNPLVLDAGDFSEGSIFFTDNHGLTTFQIMQNLNYDALVLGNHEWLVGPEELYNSLDKAQSILPILSANLDMTNLDPKLNLGKFIKPYSIKEMGGIKIGILGLSTFQFIFDSFFLPVVLQDPVKVAASLVSELKSTKGCQVVIVLSHLGFTADVDLAKQVPGIDIIVGGHTHVLLKKPFSANGVPILHVGRWGQYIGDYDFSYNGKGVSLVKYQIHQIDTEIPENPYVKSLLDGKMQEIEKSRGPLFSQKLFTSDTDLPLQDFRSEDIVGHWAADALRSFAKTDLAFENPSYVERDILKGGTTVADFFDIFPHIFNPDSGKAWTIKTFSLKGHYVQLLLDAVFRSGIYLRMSNAKAVLDLYRTIDQLYSLELAGAPVDPNRMYSIAATDGVVAALDTLSGYGVDIGVTEVHDTGMEAWRIIADYFRQKSPITREKITWEGRVRTLQPDLTIRPEEISYSSGRSHTLTLSLLVRNAGMQMAQESRLTIKRTELPGDTLSDRNVEIAGVSKPLVIKDLQPNETQKIDVDIETSGLIPGRYAVTYFLTPVAGELETENNILNSYIDIGDKK